MPIITQDIDTAVAHLRRGEPVAIPTETVYGLAADAHNADAIARIYALKGRPASNPLIVHVGDPDWVDAWAATVPATARSLMQAFWPGPLTLVLDARDDVPRSITAGQNTVAIRQPDHPVCLELLRRLGRAVVAPSANRFMGLSPTAASHVAAQFPDTELLILDGGRCRVGVESTIVGLSGDQRPRLLRPGMLERSAIERTIGARLTLGADATIRVPGQHARHYAPTTSVHLFELAEPAARNDPHIGWIFCGRPVGVAGPVLDLGDSAVAYARELYAALYMLDQAQLDALYVQAPPEGESWRAVWDRLRRASSPSAAPNA